ncbi:MAG: hypothetical protein L0287_20890 [Anaerolineae bacterium]|nr:hypothetical protein [Anaerolineae bacterium]MCI0609223.1 hypothetical protein [Anaerolineae bacterium]
MSRNKTQAGNSVIQDFDFNYPSHSVIASEAKQSPPWEGVCFNGKNTDLAMTDTVCYLLKLFETGGFLSRLFQNKEHQ